MKRLILTGVLGGIVGAVFFWWYQTTFQGASLPAFIGSQIVRQGDYSLSPTLVGWAVHLGVSFSYGSLLAFVAQILFPRNYIWNRAASLGAALFLGWIATLIAPPAIQITIALLSGKGFPATLWGLNPASGHTFWNHVFFFVLVWAMDTGFSKWLGENDQNVLDFLMSFTRKEMIAGNA